MDIDDATDLREWVGQRDQRKPAGLAGAQAHLYMSIIDSSVNLLRRDDQPSEELCDNALIQTLCPLLSELYLGILGFFFFSFKSTEEKECQGYWCIQWLRNVCHLKPFHFLPDTTKKLFNKVSLCFSQCHYASGLFFPLFIFNTEDNNEMLVSIAQNNCISRQSIKWRKVSGSPKEIREEGWAEDWCSGSRDNKRQDQILTPL